MKFRAEIDIMPHAELLDPQGKTVLKNMKNINVEGVQEVRIGKHISMTFEAKNKAAAKNLTKKTCEKLLANLIMERYEFELFPVAEEEQENNTELEESAEDQEQVEVEDHQQTEE
ncbi:MAG: phosphoribosylformylglycinamidine synthase subunit PurS [Bacteroidota bacterium]